MWLKRQIRRTGFWLMLLLAAASLGRAQVAAVANSAPTVQAVAAIGTTVADMDRSVAFYAGVLSFRKTSDEAVELPALNAAAARARVVNMKLGEESIQLIQFQGKPGRKIPPDSRSNDFWFQHIAIIVSDMDRAYAILQANKVEPASVSPQRLPDWNRNAAGIRAFYFKDPDGHPLEILQFPNGKGDTKWQDHSGRIFLGIDHTAIVVRNTDASLKFYRDLLGMRIAGQSENYGSEQERLNNVSGAHLRITSLRAENGPGIELLEYLSPHNGRRLSFQPSMSDLVHRHTLLLARDPATLAKRLPAMVATASPYLPEAAVFTVRDPDGHELMIRSGGITTTMGELK